VISYRFRRRAFLTALSGGVGLKIMLRNLEGSAQGMRSPARLLVTHWPVGIVAGSNDALWKPTVGSVGGSPGLRPFADLGLGPDMTVIRGLKTTHLTNAGSGSEGGMVLLVTGVSPPGTRAGQVQSSDAYAGGPSFEQVLLRDVPALRRPMFSYANLAADQRTDFGEISAKTLSYATTFQSVPALSGSGQEAVPLRGNLSPLSAFNTLFQSFVPPATGTGGGGGAGGGGGGAGGGAPPPVADAMLKKLVGRQSVLDFAGEELRQIRRMVPAAARAKLDVHTDAVAAAEAAVANAINQSYPNPGGGRGGSGGATGGAMGSGGSGEPTCVGRSCRDALTAPPPDVRGMEDPPRGYGYTYGNPVATQDDGPLVGQVGRLHLDVLKAAFVCDILRVATFQWAPSLNHVGLALYPGTSTPYEHHPTSHKVFTAYTTAASTPEALEPATRFLYNAQLWYFERHADALAAWKNTVDGCGNPLLDFTCVPFLTEVTACGHERSNMPAMLIGGKQLGFAHDRYVTTSITINELWGTIAQAFGHASTDAPFAAPVPGFWTQP
jgi:hypothetical protein